MEVVEGLLLVGGSWVVYMVQNPIGHIYTGITKDITRRIEEHNGDDGKGSKWCRGFGPVELIWIEWAGDRSSASKRECFLKSLSHLEKLDISETSQES